MASIGRTALRKFPAEYPSFARELRYVAEAIAPRAAAGVLGASPDTGAAGAAIAARTLSSAREQVEKCQHEPCKHKSH